MKLTCADCGFEFEEAIVRDGLGWKGICPKCGQSFDVAIPRGPVVMMFADDSNPEKDAENFVDDFKDAAPATSSTAWPTLQRRGARWWGTPTECGTSCSTRASRLCPVPAMMATRTTSRKK